MAKFKHELGKKAHDIITGFSGIIIGRAEHLTGCNIYGIAPQALKDGKRLDIEWFDEGRIRVTGDGIAADEEKAEKNGCDTNPDNPKIK